MFRVDHTAFRALAGAAHGAALEAPLLDNTISNSGQGVEDKYIHIPSLLNIGATR